MTKNFKSNIHEERKGMLTACKRQSESLNDVSSSGSFHDGGAYLPALLSNFDNFISREKTPHYGSGSRKSRVNPIVAGELGSLRVERQNVPLGRFEIFGLNDSRM
jgi:hypothetical protein